VLDGLSPKIDLVVFADGVLVTFSAGRAWEQKLGDKGYQTDTVIFKPFNVHYLQRRMEQMIQEMEGDGG
jgi:hypothetical protein